MKLRRLVEISPRRWLRMLSIAVSAVHVEWLLRRREPLPAVADRMGVCLAADGSPTDPESLRLTDEEWRRIQDVRRVISRPPFDGSCLRQALIVGQQLRNRKPRLQVGVLKDSDGVRAHAWLLVDGVVFDDYHVRKNAADGFAVMPLDFHQRW